MSHLTRASLLWSGKSSLPLHWTVITTDASLTSWGRILGLSLAHGRLTPEEPLPVDQCSGAAGNQAVPLHVVAAAAGSPSQDPVGQCHGSDLRQSSWGMWRLAAALEVSHILQWAEHRVPALSAVYIPGVENGQADYLNRQLLDQVEWSLHPEAFRLICLRWGMPDLLVSLLHWKVHRFVARTSDLLTEVTLVAPRGYYELIYAFPPLKLLPRLLRRVETEGIPVTLVAPDWHGHPGIVRMMADIPWRLPVWEDPLSQGPRIPPCFNGIAVESQVLRDRGLMTSVISTMLRACKSTSRKIYHRSWKAYIFVCFEAVG
ncbi:uncharacterized protein LOC143974745 [Lithobates pipiens]